MAASTKFVQHVWKAFLENKGHDYQCFPNMKIVSARPGYVRASYKIEPYNVNRLKSLHGGLVCSLVDTMGSLALSSRGMFMTGVSTDMHITFLRPSGGIGDSLDIESHLMSMGKTLAFTKINLLHPETGNLLATGTHTKFIKTALTSPGNVKFDSTGDKVVEGETDGWL